MGLMSKCPFLFNPDVLCLNTVEILTENGELTGDIYNAIDSH